MGLIPEEIIAQVVDRCDIVETIGGYLPLKRAGRNFKANCPFHNEKTPSFVVNPDKQIFHCFGCGVGGNVVSFVMQQERLEFPEAIRLLAEKVNVDIPETEYGGVKSKNLRQLIFRVNDYAAGYFHNILLSDKQAGVKQARDYLKSRSIDLETVKRFQIGFAHDKWDGLIKHLLKKDISFSLMEKAGLIIARDQKEGFYDRFRNRIIFPICDTRGQTRAFGARAWGKEESQQKGAKYINSPETFIYTKGQHLYGFHLAKDAIVKKDFVIIVEGYTDCIMPHQHGCSNMVAALGTALTVDQIRLLRRYTKNVVMLFDMDQAGESAMIRSLDILIEEGIHVKVASLDKNQDPDSFLRQNGIKLFEQRIEESQTLFDYKLNVLLKEHNVRSAEGKAKISGEMLPTIDKYNSAVLKSEHIKRLAQELMIDETALLEEIKNIRRRGPKGHSREDIQEMVSEEQHRAVERDILKLILEEDRFLVATKKEIDPSDFQDMKIRDCITKLFDLFQQGKKIDAMSLINCFEDQKMRQMISQLMVREEYKGGDKTKMHRDYITRIKNDRLKLLRGELLNEIKQAENAGDTGKLDKLKEKFNQLIKH